MSVTVFWIWLSTLCRFLSIQCITCTVIHMYFYGIRLMPALRITSLMSLIITIKLAELFFFSVIIWLFIWFHAFCITTKCKTVQQFRVKCKWCCCVFASDSQQLKVHFGSNLRDLSTSISYCFIHLFHLISKANVLFTSLHTDFWFCYFSDQIISFTLSPVKTLHLQILWF